MACCPCCCGGSTCTEGQEGKCCCGGVSGTCCGTGEYCCDGVCEPAPCDECAEDGDCFVCEEQYNLIDPSLDCAAGFTRVGNTCTKTVFLADCDDCNSTPPSNATDYGSDCSPGFCCDGECKKCCADEDCTAPPGEVAFCCDGECKDTLNDTGACYATGNTCYETDATSCAQDNQSNLFDLCGVCPP